MINKQTCKHCLAIAAAAAVMAMLAAGCGGREGTSTGESQMSAPASSSAEVSLSPHTLYTDAIAKLLAAESYDITASFVIKEEGLDMSTTQKINGSYIMLKQDGNLQAISDSSITIFGQNFTQSAYYDGTYRYYSSNGSNFKQKCSHDRFLEKNQGFSDTDFLTFEEEAMRDATAEEKDGVISLHATVASDKVREQLAEMFSGMDQTLSAGSEMLYTDPQLTLTLDKDGNLKEYTLFIRSTIPMDIIGNSTSSEMQISIDFTLTLNKIGDDITISPPDGLDTYEELPESPLSIEEILQITDALLDEQGNPVAEFDEIYAYYQEQYGAEVIEDLFQP